uniref:Reverse transcriptase domain-containing protein n=1 Tax=Xiphophorus maculatus TaxID=8083 RepID=A0A3B5R811_XIPMA
MLHSVSESCSSNQPEPIKGEKNFLSNVVPSEEFFGKLTLQKLSKESSTQLERPITMEELVKTIKVSPNGKTPGLDSIPNKFYKFTSELGTEILKTFNSSIESHRLPTSMKELLITVILKKRKDLLEYLSYRPISLLCCEINKVITSIIHPDQTGFVKGRTPSDSLRRLLHLIWKAQHLNFPVAALSPDVEKAFDRVSWSYLYYTLETFGFRHSVLEIIKMIYTDSKATVTTNGSRSTQFLIERGTKQGDPLSPLLFIIALKPLDQAIRQNKIIKGITMDDVLLLLSNPEESLPPLLDLINNFSELSRYKIYWSKCPCQSFVIKAIYISGNFRENDLLEELAYKRD